MGVFQKSCRNLQVLDLSNAIFSSCLLPLNIEQLQIGCPLLRKLLMANSLFKAKPVWVGVSVSGTKDTFCFDAVSMRKVSVYPNYQYIQFEFRLLGNNGYWSSTGISSISLYSTFIYQFSKTYKSAVVDYDVSADRGDIRGSVVAHWTDGQDSWDNSFN